MDKQQKQRILLIGNPNAGKTLLFNRLTGLKAKVANYPGVTVECRSGNLVLPKVGNIEVVDLPGTYSLHACSEDEQITLKGVCGELPSSSNRDLLIAVVDATQLERNLYLVTQLITLGRPMVIALSMMDMARKKRILIDTQLLSERLGLPVISLSGLSGEGLEDLKNAIALHFSASGSLLPQPAQAQNLPKPSADDVAKAYKQIRIWLDGAYHNPRQATKTFRIDKLVLHPFLGPLLLLVIFGLMFESLFAWSKPIIEDLEGAVGFLGENVRQMFDANSLFGSLLADGVIAGVGSVIAFVPLIAILFFFIGVLEDSGYLARATFLLDRLMSKVGLPGRAFVPLLSGFACAVPAILATRVIESRKDRLITILVTPLMACSARLPVYGLLIATAFSTMPPLFGFVQVGAVVMLSMYALGIVAAFGMAAIFKHLLFKGPTSSLILELPPYRMPRWSPLLQTVLLRVRIFLREAGTIILAMTVVLWALFTFPRQDIDTPASTQLQKSYAGQMGHFIEPVLEPLGFDWKIGVGLLASFTAREVLVSTLGVIYGLGQDQDDKSSTLRSAIAQDINPKTGKPVYTPLVALSLMVFFSLAMQCMSTLAATKKETKSFKWPALQFGYMTALAWICSFAVFQVGSGLGF
jgi:ferrous iron transport protein B